MARVRGGAGSGGARARPDRDAFDALVRQASEDDYDPAQAAAQALAAIDQLRAMQLGGGEGASAHLAEAAALAELEPA